MKKILFPILIIVSLCVGGIVYYYNKPASKEITIHAHPMLYACGDENDDMRVESVNDSTHNFLLETDVDPHAKLQGDEFDFDEYNYRHSKEFVSQTYILTGYLNPDPHFGCDDDVPRFIVSSIQCMDGTNKIEFEN